jgi:hypothetical protein
MTSAPEEWIPVPETAGRYDVSSLGRVRSNGWNTVTSDGRNRRVPARILSAKPSHDGGYVMVNLRMPTGEIRHVHVHTLVLVAFVGPRPAGLYGCHNNGNSSDNRVVNLRWDTPRSNSLDKSIHGTDHNVRKTECGSCGSPYDDKNTLVFGPTNKWRRCKSCMRRYARTTYHRNKQKGMTA